MFGKKNRDKRAAEAPPVGEQKERKKFKDTKAFAIAKKLVPSLVGTIADIIPGGAMIKGVISAIAGTGTKLSPEDEAILLQYMADCYELEVRDRESARAREVAMAKAGDKNWTQNILAFLGVLGFFGCISVLFLLDLKPGTEKILMLLIGTLSSIATAIFSYYFGSSKGSKDKTKAMLEKL